MGKNNGAKKSSPDATFLHFLDKYKPEFCDRVVEYAKMGMNFYEIADIFEVTDRTLQSWANKFDDFRAAYQRALNARSSFLQKQIQDNIAQKFFNQKGIDLLWHSLQKSLDKRTLGDAGLDFTDKTTYKEQVQHALDIMSEMRSDEARSLSETLKNLHLTSEAMEAVDLLREMKEKDSAK
jgi:hypothetical protein